jgi:riboflavin synthase
MFTGLIERLGTVEALDPVSGGARLCVVPDSAIENLAAGESIAVNGACLTAEPASKGDRLAFFLSDETLAKTSLGGLRPGDLVNLERALAAGDRLGGHLVMGHVDTVGTLRRLNRHGDGWDLEIGFPEAFRPFVAPKGSVTIDGISLTPVDVTPTTLTVAVIPHTYQQTNLRAKKPGDPVNLEADIIARYVVHFLTQTTVNAPIDLSLLKHAGF